jgi:hypothetical protein
LDAPVTTQPGSLGVEAARLVEALAQWARTGAADLPLATDSAECRVCPLCQLLSVARQTRPETFAHLTDAASSLVAALRTVVDSHGAHHGAERGGVERIDLDDEHSPNENSGVAR